LADFPRQLQDGLSGRYALERELGRGGMATVFLAHDLKHDRPVALKVLHPELAAALGPERFQREIRFAARLQHPHILTVLDSGEAAGQLWFTMPYVEGESLRARLNRERQLPLEDALQIAREAARALDHAHQHGIVHRDIKPENILLTRDGSTLVADFGIARALTGDERLTQTGMAVGTPAYMSPEQASGDKGLDARTDVYSLGAVLFELLSGEPPYTGATAQQIIVKRFTDPVPSVRRTRPNVPETVDQAIQRALAPIPADRFATPAQFAQALGTISGARTAAPAPTARVEPASATVATPSQPAGSAPRRPIRLPAAALALGLGFLIGLGVLFAWRRSHAGADSDSTGPKRIAVLPFENLGDSATEYFADGVTDAVRGKLSALPGLQVIASRSSNEYKRSDKSLPVIGRELGTDYLVIARIRWAKGPDGTSRVEVSPELVDVSPGRAATTKWQQPFEAAMTDVFKVQAEIASRVAASLDVALGAEQKQVLTERPTASLAAYEAFLKGEAATQSVGSFDASALRSGIGFYEKAVALDSTFAQAWAQLARAQAAYYYSVIPTPAAADGSRRAAERAVALAPDHPEGQLALGDYFSGVRGSNAEALAAYEAGLRIAPANAELLTGSALAEQSLGRWEAALAHLQRAAQLDPRSIATARRLGLTLIRLRRYPEAQAAAERGVRLSPAGLDLIQNVAMVHLGRGDLDKARAVLQGVPKEVEPTALVAFMGTYWDLFWVLDDAQQQLLLRLPPSAFGDDRGNWGIVLAQTHYLRGDRARARIYADSARIAFLEQLAAAPNDAQRQAFVGLALAYMGQKAEAIRAGERAVALTDPVKDGFIGPYIQHLLVRTYLLGGEPEKALDRLEPLLRLPYHLSPGWLRIDPAFAPLKGNPRFEKLAAGS
jgi:serine/threonine protein kinase/tetratricopeptide (TPR) repeat protein